MIELDYQHFAAPSVLRNLAFINNETDIRQTTRHHVLPDRRTHTYKVILLPHIKPEFDQDWIQLPIY